MANSNEELLARGYAAFAAGDMDGVFAEMADNIVWHVGGSSPLAGDYAGHEAVAGLFGQLMDVTGFTFKLDVHDVLANDTHGAVLCTAHAESDGRALDMRQVHIWHLAGGKSTEFWTFPEDSAANDEFFS